MLPAFAMDVVAAAWDSIQTEELGAIYNDHFEPTGGKVVVGHVDPQRVELGDTTREFRSLSSKVEAVANARGWGLGSLDLAANNNTDYGVYRAVEKTYLLQVPSEATLVPTDITDAAYYVAGIYYGRLYEVSFWGSQESVSGAIQVGGAMTAARGGLGGWAEKSSVQYQIRTVGFREKAGNSESALFAKDSGDRSTV